MADTEATEAVMAVLWESEETMRHFDALAEQHLLAMLIVEVRALRAEVATLRAGPVTNTVGAAPATDERREE